MRQLLDPESNLVNLQISMKPSGAIVASNGDSHQSAWVRDMAAIGLGYYKTGDYAKASKIAECLYKAYSRQPQRDILDAYTAIASNQDLVNHKFLNGDACWNVPHTKFSVNEQDELVNYDDAQGWGMQQIDAWGYALLLIGQLAKEGHLNLAQLDAETNAQNKESILVSLCRFMKIIQCWDQLDLGAWENIRHRARASSVAAAASGLIAVKEYFEAKNWQEDQNTNQLASDLDFTINKCKETLQKRIPIDGSSATEANERPTDAALLFILSLSNPEKLGLNRQQEDAILNSIYKLMGPVGIKRFRGDNYEPENWVTNPVNHDANPKGEFGSGREAEWAIFDPYLATFFFKRFIKSEGEDLESIYRADQHMRRALAQVNSHEQSYNRLNIGKRIVAPAREVAEAHWLSTDLANINYQGHPLDDREKGHVIGENHGLKWTKIALQEALHYGAWAYESLEKSHELVI
jgi:hypothetical protein